MRTGKPPAKPGRATYGSNDRLDAVFLGCLVLAVLMIPGIIVAQELGLIEKPPPCVRYERRWVTNPTGIPMFDGQGNIVGWLPTQQVQDVCVAYATR